VSAVVATAVGSGVEVLADAFVAAFAVRLAGRFAGVGAASVDVVAVGAASVGDSGTVGSDTVSSEAEANRA
jgi:hypothetical protein